MNLHDCSWDSILGLPAQHAEVSAYVPARDARLARLRAAGTWHVVPAFWKISRDGTRSQTWQGWMGNAALDRDLVASSTMQTGCIEMQLWRPPGNSRSPSRAIFGVAASTGSVFRPSVLPSSRPSSHGGQGGQGPVKVESVRSVMNRHAMPRRCFSGFAVLAPVLTRPIYGSMATPKFSSEAIMPCA